MAMHSSILARKISRTGEPGGPQVMGLQGSDTTAVTARACVVVGFLKSALDDRTEIGRSMSF